MPEADPYLEAPAAPTSEPASASEGRPKREPRPRRPRAPRGATAADDSSAETPTAPEPRAEVPEQVERPERPPRRDRPARPDRHARTERTERPESNERPEGTERPERSEGPVANNSDGAPSAEPRREGTGPNDRPWQDRGERPDRNGRGRRGRRQRGRGRRGGGDRPEGQDRGPRPDRGDRGERRPQQDRIDSRDFGGAPPVILVVDGETTGWFDPARDAGFVRRAEYSYLAQPDDTWVPPHLVRQYSLRRGDQIAARTGRDARGRLAVAEIVAINGDEPKEGPRRPDFQTLTASYPERRLTLETGKPAKGGPELTRRAIDLIAPIGYGQRALIVAPARAGKTMLMQAITEGIAINHPEATLLILLVDERPEEVSEAISWGVGEVIASSFDQPAKRHVEVVEMVIERSRRLVEQGKDVVIVLDSLTRMARAFNTAERGTGRTLSGGLDTSAMARPKAFFGSARYILPQHGGGSLTIIATALVETGSRMDDVIFEEFKGTGNCEIKLDRSLSEKRIFPAFDIATSGTRREEKLYKAEQIDSIYTLRRGLQQMPPQAGMEWLIKRIAGTTSNDALLAGL
jgi:transcription termination factor Rho